MVRGGGYPGRGARLGGLLLLLEEAVDLEPVGAAAVAAAGLGHADHEALAQAACLARGAVLLVDDALAVVFAFCYRVQVVV